MKAIAILHLNISSYWYYMSRSFTLNMTVPPSCLLYNSLVYRYISIQVVINNRRFYSNKMIFERNKGCFYSASKYIIISNRHVKDFKLEIEHVVANVFNILQHSFVLIYLTSRSNQENEFKLNWNDVWTTWKLYLFWIKVYHHIDLTCQCVPLFGSTSISM